MDPDGLETVLRKMRRWQPFDGGALLDDIAVVLDDLLPPEECVEALGQRLRGHLARLVDIAVATEAELKDEGVAQHLARAR